MSEPADNCTFSRWAYAHYFNFMKNKDMRNIIVNCTLCAKPKELSTPQNSTSNLTKHLQRCHRNMKLARKQAEEESGDKTKQPKLTFFRSEILQPQEVRRLVAEYVVEDMLPLSTVESPAFRKIVSKIPVATSSKDEKVSKAKVTIAQHIHFYWTRLLLTSL